MNACGTSLQETIRESTNIAAEVGTSEAGDIHFEDIERVLQLQSRAGDEGVVAHASTPTTAMP
jgi:hypothetical protein